MAQIANLQMEAGSRFVVAGFFPALPFVCHFAEGNARDEKKPIRLFLKGIDLLRGWGQHGDMKNLAVVAAAVLALAGALTQCSAQDGAPPPAPGAVVWSGADLDQMLGPIALYPDPLIGLILPASTVPSQIVLASRYVSEGGDPNEIASQPWDASVQGLAHYPTVLKWMDDNIAWTTELGEAFAGQQSEVMDSIQRLRAKAQALGNLQSTPQENVQSDDGTIDITPTDENEVYVPEYQPELIYYQPGVYCSLGSVCRLGCGWASIGIGGITIWSTGVPATGVLLVGGTFRQLSGATGPLLMIPTCGDPEHIRVRSLSLAEIAAMRIAR